MTDAEKREKVLMGLTCCANLDAWDERVCRKCPYNCDEYGNGGCEDHLIADTFILLKEQEEGIEPIKSTHEQKKYAEKIGIFMPDFWCGACKFNLIEHPKFCPNCGKKVKWEDE